MNNSNPAFDEFVRTQADTCIKAAALFLDGKTMSKHGTDPGALWTTDEEEWVTEFGSSEPSSWLSEIAVGYLGEAAYELKAIAKLLRSRLVVGSLDVLVRAVMERSGRVIWVLDDQPLEGTAFNRAARAALEIGVSSQHYLKTIDDLGATGVERAQADINDRDHRAKLIKWFSPVRPTGRSKDDIRQWQIKGTKSPGFTAIAKFAGERCRITAEQGEGVYGGLSGFSHPSIVFSRESRTPNGSGGIEFNYRAEDIEKLVRMAVLTFLEALKYCARYYGTGIDSLMAKVFEIEHRLDESSVLTWRHGNPQGPI